MAQNMGTYGDINPPNDFLNTWNFPGPAGGDAL